MPAEELLSEYLEISDAGLEDEFDRVLAGSALSSALDANSLMQQLNLSQLGETEFYSLQTLDDETYAFCLDVSKTKLIDQSGDDVTPVDRPLQVPMVMKTDYFSGSSKITELDIRRFSKC
ncbi:MAG: hypothetical protein RI530_02460 [Microbacteriaceae bacterium]|nr:hypothetical protein [Microbacteriaceae bacterium]